MNSTLVWKALLLMGIVSFLVAPLFGLGSGCLRYGDVEESSGGFQLFGFEDGQFLYTPDGGLNRCYAKPGYLLFHFGLGAMMVGVVVARFDYARNSV